MGEGSQGEMVETEGSWKLFYLKGKLLLASPSMYSSSEGSSRSGLFLADTRSVPAPVPIPASPSSCSPQKGAPKARAESPLPHHSRAQQSLGW